uniref:Uncharacterized protein n=1 Tax=Timema shepardi TaxID=629360 RepID=A0A7R9B2Z5_TIMSH|nr:unnamed protein product [Timema shepardi]
MSSLVLTDISQLSSDSQHLVKVCLHDSRYCVTLPPEGRETGPTGLQETLHVIINIVPRAGLCASLSERRSLEVKNDPICTNLTERANCYRGVNFLRTTDYGLGSLCGEMFSSAKPPKNNVHMGAKEFTVVLFQATHMGSKTKIFEVILEPNRTVTMMMISTVWRWGYGDVLGNPLGL